MDGSNIVENPCCDKFCLCATSTLFILLPDGGRKAREQRQK